ncbi:MAG TPA: flagellar hook-basal body complex protein FliE [Clostridiales bacterium]|nr:flagellar hook-basal body complex protein FliE [Clostridiales bacterium]
MNIASVNNLGSLSNYGQTSALKTSENRNAAFEDIFQSALNLVKQTNDYTNAAEEAETAYALGLMDSTTDLMVAQQKANYALQYTVAVRNNVMDAYKEIMNLQF